MLTPSPRFGPMLALLSAWSADIPVRSSVGWPNEHGNPRERAGFESLLRTAMSALRWWCRATPVLAVLSALSAYAGSGFIGRAAPEWDALFQRESGWIGADGDYSIPLDRDTTLWLFSDTFVGRVKDGKRLDARMINNSIALQRGTNAPEFFYGTATNGQPASFVTPQGSRRGYFWLAHGLRTDRGLFFFMQRVETVNSGTPFGFKLRDGWLAQVANPDATPARWRITQTQVP